MIETWLPLALLALLAMAFVLIPLRRLRTRESVQQLHVREEKNREIFAQREKELEQEVRDGTVASEDYQRMMSELQRSFMADMQGLQTQPRRGATLLWVPLVLALMIPVAAFVVYHYKGSATDLQLPALIAAANDQNDKEAQAVALDQLANFLADRLQRRPKDIQNGYMLGTLYLGLDRPAEAIAAFRHMLGNMKPSQDKALVLGQMAQAMFLQSNDKLMAEAQSAGPEGIALVITAETQAALDEAVELNPNEQSVMGIYAVQAYFKRDYLGALKYWRRQLSDMRPGSADAQTLRQRITAIEANLPEEMKAAAQGPRLSIVVNIAPELADKVTKDMRLFVYAKNPAMPMPIAVQNLDVSSFPLTVTLDNSNSMTGAQLDSASQLVVGARLSRAGALSTSGALEALSAPIVLKDQTGPLTLTINSIAP